MAKGRRPLHVPAGGGVAGEHELLERIFDTTELQIAYLDTALNFVRVNRAYARAAEDRDPAFFVGLNHFELYPNPENEAIFQRVLEGGEPHVELARPFEYRGHPERGTSYWNWTVQRVLDGKGAPTGLLLTLVDVTMQVQSVAALQASERALREREAYYRGLVEASMEGLATVGGKLGITDVNRRFCEMVGVERDQLLGTPFTDWFTDLEAAAELVRRTRTEGALHDYPLTMRAADGRETPVTLSATLFGGQRGDMRAIFASIHDLTFTRRLEQQLRQAQKMDAIGRLAGGVAHDFKNMLTVINLYAGLVASSLAPDDPRRADVDEIVDAGERAATLIRQLLTLGRRQEARPTVIQVEEVVPEIVPMLRRLVGSAVALSVDAAPGLGRVLIDPAQLDEVFVNLVTNAREAMPEGGNLTIELRNAEVDADYARDHPGLAPGAYVTLTVSDTGAGMDAATLDHIFEPFYTTRPVGQGTGLGLSTVYGIVAGAGGHIEVQSAVGQGTTFTILLPQLSSIEDAAPAGQAEASARER